MARIIDPITAQVINNALINAAQEAGLALQLSAFSPNIRERLDFSTAIYDDHARLLAQAEHIPVHLGAMIEGVKFLFEEFDFSKLSSEDVIINNDPYLGGTHLPDISLTAPIFMKNELIGIITNRAHHADVGGTHPGSMPGGEYTLDQEGYVIHPQFLIQKGTWNNDLLKDFLSRVRSPNERKGDLQAQLASIRVGQQNIQKLWNRHGKEQVINILEFLRERSAIGFQEILKELPSEFLVSDTDYLDDDGITEEPINITVTISKHSGNQNLHFDFSKSARQTRGNINAPKAVALAAVYYVIRALVPQTFPTNAGLYEYVNIIMKEGTILDPIRPAGVAGGNVETSQRIVDVILKALSKLLPKKINAANCGSMNNLAIGSDKLNFTYYETIAGGLGAAHGFNGRNATHAAMTNTGNTPIEILETEFPIRIKEYSIRWNSGGEGTWSGGCGIRRAMELLDGPAILSLLSDRRIISPYGLYGGAEGKTGNNFVQRGNEAIKLKSKTTFELQKGDIVVIETPGGGGYGKKVKL
ncbi:MAG: hydantoinase B/oxoprolinase family protein [Candidatus Lokiarchaeota archaeon]|nr:hydantoinase B/oxoprolinase family protein [Candidatus Lokiarchaeota archaeon]